MFRRMLPADAARDTSGSQPCLGPRHDLRLLPTAFPHGAPGDAMTPSFPTRLLAALPVALLLALAGQHPSPGERRLHLLAILTLAHDTFSACGNMAMLAPGNDTRGQPRAAAGGPASAPEGGARGAGGGRGGRRR